MTYFIAAMLQMFADAGTLVNATGNFVNAYTGQTTPFDTANTLAGELKTFYDTELLENARPTMVYAQFAKKQALPAGRGKTVEWRKWNTFAKADALTEGVIPTGQKFGMSSIPGSIMQFGTYASITDQLELHAYDDVILGATEEMGASMSATQEALIVAALLEGGTNVVYCDNINASGVKVGNTPTDPTEMHDSPTQGVSLLTPTMVNQVATKLKKDKAKTINGKYVAVIHPSVAYDLRQSNEWIEAHKYAGVTELYNGEIGELHGVRFIENPDAPVMKDPDDDGWCNAEGGAIYATWFFGADSFGIIDPEGGAAEMIIHDKSEAGGPLNQFSTIGYKFSTNGATLLYPERCVRVMSCSYYSSVDEDNVR